MGLSLGGLVQGAGSAYAGYGRGQIAGEQAAYQRQQQQEALQRQIAQQALQDQLTNLQIAHGQQQLQLAPALAARAAQEFQTDQALKTSTTRKNNAEADKAGRPEQRNIDPNSPAGIAARVREFRLTTGSLPHPGPAGQVETDATGNMVVVDPRAAQARPVTMGGQPVKGAPKGGAAKGPTDEQARAEGFRVRAATADQHLSSLESPGGMQRTKAAVPLIGNFLASGNTQAFEQAEREFVNAMLRRESGAAISASEFADARNRYIPQPGDGPEVRQQKAASRASAIQALTLSAGPVAGKVDGGTPSFASHAGSPADRWEQLVASGMDKAKATAQVQQEFGQ